MIRDGTQDLFLGPGAIVAATEARLRRDVEPEWESEPLDVEDAISRYLT